LLVGAVEGLGKLAALARLQRPRWWAIGVLVAATVPYSAYTMATDRAGASERSQAGFDAACAWIARNASQPGPVLTRQPGEVFLRSGRTALAPPTDDAGAIERTIMRYGVAYLLVDEARYAAAPVNPLTRFAAAHPERVERVWSEPAGARGASYAVFAVPRNDHRPGPSNFRRP
jgi:hypothetical protein